MDNPQQSTKKKPFLSRGLRSLASILAIASLSFASHADLYEVNTSSDESSSSCPSSCSLRAAIRAANASLGADQITILDGISPILGINGTSGIDENAATLDDLDITDDLTIIGGGNSRTTISAAGIGGGVGDRVFHIHGVDVSFQNVSIEDGNLDIQTVIDSNGDEQIVGTPAGAGIYLEASSYVTLDNVAVTNNTINTNSSADFNTVGGGIFVADKATIIINDSKITQNKAPSGGGINNAGRTDIRRTLIDQNDATNASISVGGGINNQGGYLSLGSSTLSNNTSTQLGGGMYSSNQGQNSGNVIITNSVVYNNVTKFGGAGIANFGPLTISNSAIVENSTLDTNTGDMGNGAGIFNSGLGSLDMVNSTISHNSGAHSGGGIFNSRDMNLTNVTLYGNEAIPCTTPSADCIANSQVGGNQITLFTSSDSRPSMILSNTIIGNSPASAAEPPCAGSTGYTNDVRSQGSNMENADSCGLGTGDLVNLSDLGLDALDSDPTPPTGIQLIGGQAAASQVHPLQDTSLAINGGSNSACPLLDQRFMLRDNICDIGAYEYGATEQQSGDNYVDLKAIITDTPDPAAPGQPLTYIVLVTNLYVDTPASDVVISIDLPDTFSVNPNGANFSATGIKPICSPPDADNIITCTASSILGLGRVEISVNGTPRVAGTIEARVDVFSQTDDAFAQNNTNITAETVIDPEAGCTTNFGNCGTTTSGGSGGGTPHPLALLLTGLILLGRRFRASTT